MDFPYKKGEITILACDGEKVTIERNGRKSEVVLRYDLWGYYFLSKGKHYVEEFM